ncbi:amidohydrolase family protein [Pontixanthobacter aestiaquae]|uniref:Amidohydrolase family protein n=1 Tax=Pontixanthobacter aestiaquae TaxID=1509367 RepID=A0A844Z860_9SPHN|nr:amidohydrolase family protein [Pontixanthobacter aestiaquae]MDN3645748.1 amidohydrolase family protein [Pontixanthobacter aestiaquae]MXO83257.1 amidohydrolase family protein [Pontixanthobacter aestiaquae]
MFRSILLAIASLWAVAASAQTGMEPVPERAASEGQGPYSTVIVRGATMIDGTGAPPEGPVDIVIEDNRIAAIARGGVPQTALDEAVRVIDARGMYVMPGFVDVHGHNGDPRKAPQPSYGYKLWLAHGVTTVRGVSFGFGPDSDDLDHKVRSAANTIVAPRLFAYAVLGDKWSGGPISTPAKAREWVRWAAAAGYDGIKFFNTDAPDVMAAAIDEAEKQKLGTVAHLGQRGVAQVNAAKAVEMGLGGVTHFYGHMESLLKDGALPRYPNAYNYLDEQSRFSEVARLADQIVEPGSDPWNAYVDHLLESGVTLSPTFNIYAASRDVMRERNADWHEKYTLPSLMNFYAPSLTNHGSYYHDWSTADEVAWRKFYGPWMQLTNEFKNKGGRVTVGSDPGYIYQTWGFAYIGEFEMLQEAGFAPLEVIQAATMNGADEIYQAKSTPAPFGTIKVGKLADLVIAPENPLANFKTLYGTGHLRLNRETNVLERVGGVRWTIKDGIVYDAHALLKDVEMMVAEKKAAPE